MAVCVWGWVMAETIKIEMRIHFRRFALWVGYALALLVVRMRAVTESGRQLGGWAWHRLSAEA